MQEQALLIAIVQNLKRLCRFKRRRPRSQTGVWTCRKPESHGGVSRNVSRFRCDARRDISLIGYVHTTGFSNGAACLRIDALNASGSVIGSFDSPSVSGTTPWTRVDGVVPASQIPTGTASLQVTAAVNPDANGSSAAAYFDDLTLMPYNALSAIQYDSNSNNVTSASDALGNTVTYGYGNDNTGGGFSANFTGVNTGDPNPITDANGINSYLGYNKQDQIVGYTYADQNGGTTSYPTFNYAYDPNGNLTGIQDPTGHAMSYQYTH